MPDLIAVIENRANEIQEAALIRFDPLEVNALLYLAARFIAHRAGSVADLEEGLTISSQLFINFACEIHKAKS